MKQCKACPWKATTVPDRDIPNGYQCDLHEGLKKTIAEPGSLRHMGGGFPAMACHESKPGKERMCVGWAINQLGPGNNIPLRMLALDGRFKDFETVGAQHPNLEATLPKKRRRRG